MGITAMRLNNIGYLIREGFRSISKHGFMSFASVTIIMACLIIMGSVSLLSVNIDALIKDLEDENEVVAFVDEALSYDEAAQLGDNLEKIENVKAVEFVDRETAMESFMSNYSDDMMVGIDEEVFRHRYIIHLVDIAQMRQTEEYLKNEPGVADVNAHIEYANTFVSIRNIVSVVSLVLIAILLFVSIFIMSNTIKLATFGRRTEIGIMKMVGATNSFIRTPFIIEGLVLGILGGLLAFFAEWGLYEVVTGALVTSIVGQIINVVPFMSVHKEVFIIYMAISVFVGTFGGVNAIRNYLKV